MIKRSRS